VQNVGRYCSQQDHHPEWSVTDGGRTVQVRLTSHFANNKVTLFDFQLAEHMNQQYKVTQKWFIQYPLVASSTLTTWKIVIASFVLFNFVLSIGFSWGRGVPSATQRGRAPQAVHSRPLIVAPFEITTGALKGEKEVELYAMANVDTYTFKTNTFSINKII
jgi:hypothetical protein